MRGKVGARISDAMFCRALVVVQFTFSVALITIGWSVYAIAGVLAFLIAILTVSVQSVRAALANPVKSLRME